MYMPLSSGHTLGTRIVRVFFTCWYLRVTGTVTPQVSQVNAAVTRMHNWPTSCDLFCFEHVYKGRRTALQCCSSVSAGLHPPSPRHFAWQSFSASLTNLTALMPQSHDFSCYVSRGLLAPSPLWRLTHDDIHALDFVHSPDLWHQPRLANVTCTWSWRLCGITPATHYVASRPATYHELHVSVPVARMKRNPLKQC
jgi:hypothetical protein